jgi:hypothetical protein
MEKIHREPKVTTPDDATDSSSTHDKIKCLQINQNRREKAWEKLIHQWLAEEKVHVVFIQEPCLKKIDNEQTNDCCYYFPGLPRNYRAVHNNYLMGKDKKSEYGYSAAILVHVDVPFERFLPMAAPSDNYPTTSTRADGRHPIDWEWMGWCYLVLHVARLPSPDTWIAVLHSSPSS